MSVITSPVSPARLVAEDVALTTAPIAYSGSLSIVEYDELAAVHGQKNTGRWAGVLISVVPLLAGASITYRYFVPFAEREPLSLWYLLSQWLFFLPVALACPAIFWLARRADLANLSRQRGPFEPVAGEVSAAGVTVRGSDRVDAYAWEEFRRYRETSSLIALFKYNDEAPILLAESRFASFDDWKQVKSLVASQFPASRSR